MLKKLVVGGIISMFMMVAAVPGFAASTCPYSTNTANVSQAIKSCSKSNPQLENLLKQIKARKCSNTQNIQALLQKCLSCKSTNLVKSCSTAKNCVTLHCSNGTCYTINCSTGSICPTGSCK